jgi:hypothetical protein
MHLPNVLRSGQQNAMGMQKMNEAWMYWLDLHMSVHMSPHDALRSKKWKRSGGWDNFFHDTVSGAEHQGI